MTGADGVAGRSASGSRSRIGVSIEPGTEHADPHAVQRGFRPQPVREADDRVLGHRVRRDERRRRRARRPTRCSRCARDPVRPSRVRGEDAVDDAADVHVDDAVPVRARELVGRSAHRDAGVVEQVVDAAVALARSRRRAPGTPSRRVCRAGGRRSRRARSRCGRARRPRARRLRRRCRRARRALPPATSSAPDRATDARRAAGDDRGLAREWRLGRSPDRRGSRDRRVSRAVPVSVSR